jgi:hypothetical protein
MRNELSLLVVGSLVLALTACLDRHEPKMDAVARADQATKPEAGMPADPTNTGVNVRDRDPNAVTPMDQSNAQGDVEVTRSIREAITSADALSIDAHNVKIVAEAGVVTLRGPVDSQEEKAAIVAIAMRTAGVSRVDDQLEVARD